MNRRPRRRRGFTLMEILLVLAILVVLASMVTVGYVRIQRTAYMNSARTQVAMLEEAVNHYILSVGSTPTTQDGLNALLNPPSDLPNPAKWQGPYLEKRDLPVDPWNQPFQYEQLSGEKFRIWSNGPDLTPGSPDDISTAP